MKKLMTSAFVCMMAFVMAACSGGNTPKGVAEAYSQAVIKGDYKKAVDMIYFQGTPEDVQKKKDFYVDLIESKVKEGLPEDKTLTKFEVINEEIDEENDNVIDSEATLAAEAETAINDTAESSIFIFSSLQIYFILFSIEPSERLLNLIF